MRRSSLRRNLSALAVLYGVSLAVASGCPANGQQGPSDTTGRQTRAAEMRGQSDAAFAAPPLRDVAAADSDRTASNSDATKPKFDPVKVNGRFFEGWPMPKLALLITGRQDGYLEPCGCAGLENQKGGLSRRYTLVKDLGAKGWPVVGLDVGGLVRRYGKQAEIQFGVTADALKSMGYQAVGFGLDDLRLSAGEVAAVVAGGEQGKSMFVSANVNLFGLTPKFQIIKAGDMKLGVTSVLGAEYQQQLNNADVEVTAPADALAKVVPQLKDCNTRVLLAYASVSEAQSLAKQFPDFDFVVTAGGGDEPPAQAAPIDGIKSKLIEVGHKGMFAIVLGFYNDPEQPVRYQRVALDSRFKQSDAMHRLMVSYQEQLKELGWEGLGLHAVLHPRGQGGDKRRGEFAGVETCKECHPTAYGIWSKTKHAHATETLTQLDPPRQFDPECVSCHVTGWNAQEHFPYLTGFESLEKTPLLAGNTCENCHGPAAAHVAAERGRGGKLRDEMRAALKLSAATAEDNVCRKCHDFDNSPEFNQPGGFDRYWPKVEHKGKR